jgi:predicted DNA repair protein MutK
MNKINLLNIVIGIIVILQSILIPSYISPILFLLGLGNLFLGFGGFEWYKERFKK